ncbi:MAG: DUF177 domain-containing protein [Provencibacterium sp.]|jgi:uncharacterized protein|nr:DUF177 domain-containing protein [Provencibacterium sp.]
MILDLTRLFEEEGEELRFQQEMDLSGIELAGIHPVSGPVQVEGAARNEAGIVTVSYQVRYMLEIPCDRCLTPVRTAKKLKSEQVAVRELHGGQEDDFLLLPDGQFDLDEAVYADVVLELPTKTLCSEDCRGLCPVCGINRNRQSCGCRTETGNLRLQSLRELLQ